MLINELRDAIVELMGRKRKEGCCLEREDGRMITKKEAPIEEDTEPCNFDSAPIEPKPEPKECEYRVVQDGNREYWIEQYWFRWKRFRGFVGAPLFEHYWERIDRPFITLTEACLRLTELIIEQKEEARRMEREKRSHEVKQEWNQEEALSLVVSRTKFNKESEDSNAN